MMADISGTGPRSEEADCISEERGMYYHTQMHKYPARKSTTILYQVTSTVPHAEHCGIVGGEARRRYSQY